MRALDRLPDAPDRRAIRDDLDTTLVVEAAAGTGKTTELVNRIVEILASGRAAVQQMVAVTFTEKAAGELKLRLREALDRARLAPAERAGDPADRSPDREARPGRLEEALAHLEEAHVSTIHGFCAELLRERPVEAGVDPRFEVLREADARRLYRRAFDRWLQDILEDPPEGVRRALRRRAASAGGGARARLSEAGWTLACWRDFPAAWRRDPFDCAAAMAGVTGDLHRLAALSDRPARHADTLHLDTWAARDLSRRIRALEEAGRPDPDGIESALVDLSRDRVFTRPRKGYGAQYREGVTRGSVQDAHAALLARLQAFRAAADADLAALLQRDLQAASDRYEFLKRQSGRLDFVDLLIRARDLVRDGDAVRAAFQRRFSHIFVDEFQDTDPLQAELLLLLAADDPAERDWRRVRPVAGKLFVVGDPKQSIYRFRRADVGTYRAVKEQLLAHGARAVTLSTSFRARPAIQRAVNAAFGARMRGDAATLQADYVALQPYRGDAPDQPAVVALPVPRPYGARNVSAKAIEGSLPHAVAAFVHWLLAESGWTIGEREEGWREDGGRTVAPARERRVPVSARHVAVLFRRFESWGTDVTRPYVDALQARGVPHLLVGGRSFHDREEVEAMRAALTAVEWPDDELAVFAAVHGPLVAVADEALLEYRARFGRLHPFRQPTGHVPDRLAPIVEALAALRELHRARNHVPVTETIERLLAVTRAHAAFVLRRSGEQVLANVLQLAELARAYEASAEAASFRGFLDLLADEAESGDVAEAPVLEEGAEGVRLMTVHRAKGLEFPVVVLADMTASLTHGSASRYLDAERGLCAVRIGGWSPAELLEHEAGELARDAAEAVRVAYVAATRARDLLVVPAVGDKPYADKWLSPLNAAVYPPAARRRSPEPAPACPRFGRDSVLERPDGDPATSETVSPGLHRFEGGGPDATSPTDPARGDAPDLTSCSVVWWDPQALALDAPSSFGLREEDLIGKDADPALVEADLREYEAWRAGREATLARGRAPSIVVQTATARAAATETPADRDVEVVELGRAPARVAGARLGALAHAALASTPLDADARGIADVVTLQARILGATDEERAAAADMVSAALRHPLLARAHAADRDGRCRRETPVTLAEADGTLVEGVVDLAFEEEDGWTVIDFKTDWELARGLEVYTRQVALYARAVARATGRPARAALLHLR